MIDSPELVVTIVVTGSAMAVVVLVAVVDVVVELSLAATVRDNTTGYQQAMKEI